MLVKKILAIFLNLKKKFGKFSEIFFFIFEKKSRLTVGSFANQRIENCRLISVIFGWNIGYAQLAREGRFTQHVSTNLMRMSKLLFITARRLYSRRSFAMNLRRDATCNVFDIKIHANKIAARQANWGKRHRRRRRRRRHRRSRSRNIGLKKAGNGGKSKLGRRTGTSDVEEDSPAMQFRATIYIAQLSHNKTVQECSQAIAMFIVRSSIIDLCHLFFRLARVSTARIPCKKKKLRSYARRRILKSFQL